MKSLFTCFLFFIAINVTYSQNILLVTGGHDFDEGPFFEMFSSMEGISFKHATQPEANDWYGKKEIGNFDAIVFYDMWEKINDIQKTAFLGLLEKGVGMVFLHHALVSYQEWPEFIKIIGGKYHRSPFEADGQSYEGSTYKHDVDIHVKIEDNKHYITRGTKDFKVFDEVYGDFEVLETVHPLLSTDHEESSPTIGWTNTYLNSKIVFLQPGHGPTTFNDQNYIRLLTRSVKWVSK